MRILTAAAVTLAMMMPAHAADMRIVCEERTGMITRLDLTLSKGGEPVLILSAGDEQAMFSDTPRILSHVLTAAGAQLNAGPFSTIHTEFKVTGRIYTPQTYYVDWNRARVWKSFFSLVEAPGGAEIKNCVRVD